MVGELATWLSRAEEPCVWFLEVAKPSNKTKTRWIVANSKISLIADPKGQSHGDTLGYLLWLKILITVGKIRKSLGLELGYGHAVTLTVSVSFRQMGLKLLERVC